jgi:hypothetical protein
VNYGIWNKSNLHGGKVLVNDLYSMIKNGYTENKNDYINGYEMDKDLSGNRAQVYHNPETNHTVVSHRGTQGMQDYITDLCYALVNDKHSKRFQHAKDIQQQAENKYGADNVTSIGHSLAKALANEAGQNSKEIIMLNGATTPYNLFDKQKSNEYHVRTELDPISLLETVQPFQHPENNTTIKSESYNPLTEHSYESLKRLLENTYIGK